MHNSRKGIAAIVTTIIGATLGISFFVHQPAFATPSGDLNAPNAQGKCYQTENSGFHSGGTTGEFVHD